jgi:hypothetical protein
MVHTGAFSTVSVIPLVSHKYVYICSIHDQTEKPGTLNVWHIAFGNQKDKDKITLILFSAFKGLKCFLDKETNQQYYRLENSCRQRKESRTFQCFEFGLFMA